MVKKHLIILHGGLSELISPWEQTGEKKKKSSHKLPQLSRDQETQPVFQLHRSWN